MEDTSALDVRLTAEARALGSTLDRVAATCAEVLPAVPRVDREVVELRALAADLTAATAGVAARFALADFGSPLGGPGRPGNPFGPAPTPGPIDQRLLRLLRTATELTGDELRDIGHRLVGDGSWGRRASDLSTWLSPAGGLMSVVKGTSPAERLLAGLSKVPQLAPLVESAPFRAAAPFLGRASSGMSAVGIADDVKRLLRDGLPWNAFEREGARYVEHWSRLAFDGSALACSQRPSLPTCGAAMLTGTFFAGTEAYVHRKAIGQAAHLGADVAKITAQALRQQMEAQLHAIDRGADDAIDGAARVGQATLRGLERSPGLIQLPPSVRTGAEQVLERARIQAHALKDAAETAGAEVVGEASDVVRSGRDIVGGAVHLALG